MKKIILIGLLMVIGLTAPRFGQAAFDQNSIVSTNEVVQDNFVSFANTITIDGKVEGDVLAVGSQVTINGEVTGDVIVAAYSLTVSGRVNGSIRAVATDVTVRGAVGRNVTVAVANDLMVTNIGSIAGSLSYVAGNVTIAGPIAGNVTGQAVSLDLNAEVKKDVQVGVSGKGLTLGSLAKIGGNLRYDSSETIPLNASAVAGTIEHREPRVDVTSLRQFAIKASWAFRIMNFLGLLLIGLIIIAIIPKGAAAVIHDMATRPFMKIGWGILLLIGFPIAMVVLAGSIVGLPMAVILATLYALGIYLSPVFVGLLIGQSFFAYVLRGKNMPMAVSFIVGFTAYTALTWVVYLGVFVSLAGVIWGFSSLVRVIVSHIRQTNNLHESK
ncbi:MAG: polymer-forming cytoskeletal protein [Patescibacteria group bacterium]